MAGGYDLYLEKEGGNAKYAYMNQPSAIGSTVARFTLGTNYQLDSSDSANYYHYDEAGNVILITNGSGNVVSHFEQDAWGNDLNSTFGSDIAQHQTSKYYDSLTGLYFFGARWYNPAIGRYISVSSFESLTEEEYVFCGSDPINYADYNGYLSLSIYDLADTIGEHFGALDSGVPGSVIWGNSPEASKQLIQNGVEGAQIALELASNLNPTLKGVNLAFCAVGIINSLDDQENNIKNFSKHAVDQSNSRDGGLGVNKKDISDAIANPIKIKPGKKNRLIYEGKNATIVLSRGGKVVTAWATNSRGWKNR